MVMEEFEPYEESRFDKFINNTTPRQFAALMTAMGAVAAVLLVMTLRTGWVQNGQNMTDPKAPAITAKKEAIAPKPAPTRNAQVDNNARPAAIEASYTP